MQVNKEKAVVCFGEVLWDILPSGKVPGGAPMNVAYHLHQHLVQSTIITRIGKDEPGRDLKGWFTEKGMDTRFFQEDVHNATGTVNATQEGENMRYEITKPVAWDFISLNDDLASLVRQADYFVYGSLASRNVIARQTLLSLLDHAPLKVMDINLRPPHYTRESLIELMNKADVLKLNEEELKLVSSWTSFTGSMNGEIKHISDQFNINTIIVTRGAAGALVYTNNGFYDHPGYRIRVQDTIGSGDAFLAGMIVKMINGADTNEALDYAARLGAFVASKKGGCPEYKTGEILQITRRNE